MGKMAFIYPGQGCQKAGMGQDFYEKSQKSRNVFELAEKALDMDVAELCFTENERLDQTEYTQPALVTTCLAMTEEIMARGLKPEVTAGLSLGEYPAIVVAGGMTREEAIATSAKRGTFMEHAFPAGRGAMAAILGLTGEEVEAGIKGIPGVTVANYNCPGQIVITGEAAAVDSAMEVLKERKAKRAVKLNVSGPFHSPFLETAGRKLGEVLSEITFGELKIPYITNVTAEYVQDSREIREFLIRQVASPVRWEQSIRKLIADGVTDFIEIGPGRTLTGFIKKISRDVNLYNIDSWESMEKVLEQL